MNIRVTVLTALAGMLLGVFMPGQSCQAQSRDIIEQKGELERIKKDIESSRENLDSLKQVERGVLKEISDYEQRALLNKTVLNRLNKQLNTLRVNISESKDHLARSEGLYSTTRRRYINNLKYYYSGTRNKSFGFDDELMREKEAILRLIYLRALASSDRDQVTQASVLLANAENDFQSLVDEEKKVGSVKKRKKQEYTIITSQKEQREKDLYQVRRKKETEADRLVTLSEAARQMEELIARLERARRDRELAERPTDFDFRTGNFATYKGGLQAPIRGKITKSYGWKTDEVTYLKSFSPGIEIQGRKGVSVVAAAPGVIAYTGSLRGYGNFIILEHEDGYFSTYAGLEYILGEKNQIIAKGEKLGAASTGLIKFELRQGRQSLDPVEWIRIDSF
ncbi:MAG: peptidoglycan DD-metalloendopeptidase family protein [Candidatus Zixiibacteriota bacterium]|nr:MAG: peptidoglycan DD-metalloendopeptidase family protein [candidate division Zixibacteria bacterium]